MTDERDAPASEVADCDKDRQQVLWRGYETAQIRPLALVFHGGKEVSVGLDGVEFILATEEAFQIAIPDEDIERMLTPRKLVDYVLRRLGEDEEGGCLEQRAFYRLRRASIRLFQAQRATVRPDTTWSELLPARDLRHNWALLHQAVGTPRWPALGFWKRIPAGCDTVGGTARFLATEAKAALKGSAGWSRGQVEEVVANLMREQLGITRFGWDQHFVDDLGVD